MANTEISGIEKRNMNRDRQGERRHKRARQLINSKIDFKKLVKSDCPQQLFSSMWTQFDQALSKDNLFKNYLSYVDGYNTGVEHCQDMLENHNINVGFPKLIILSSRPESFRTESWFYNGQKTLSFYLAWMKRLEITHTPSIEDVLLSLIFHSAILHKPTLDQIILDVVKGNPKLITVQELPAIDIIINDNATPTNYYTQIKNNLKAIHQAKIFLSPLTVRIVKLYLNSIKHEHPTSTEICTQTIYRRLRVFKEVGAISQSMPLIDFLTSAIYVLEDYLEVNLPEYLWYLLMGQDRAYTIPTNNWQSIVHNISHRDAKISALSAPSTPAPNVTQHYKARSKTDLAVDIAKLFKKTGAQKISKTKFTASLTELHSQLLRNEAPLNEIALTGWLLSKVTGGCEVSSVQTYSNRITNRWLSVSRGMELEDFDEDDFLYFYDELIELGRTEKAKNATASLIDEIHSYLVTHHDIEPIAALSSKVRPHRKTGYISETMFQSILNQIDSLDLNLEAIESLKLALILAHRCSLRVGEIAKIRIKDIFAVSYLDIRNNKYGNNKTSSALRRILLSKLLTKEDYELFKRVYAKRVSSEGETLIATQAGLPYQPNDLSRLLSEAIKACTGLSYLSTHHLRHSFITNFQLMSFIYDDDNAYNDHICYSWLQSLIPYTQEEAHEILTTIESPLAYKKILALAGLAGHASPTTTYSSYVHLLDIQIGLLLWHTDFKLSKAHSALLKLPRRQQKSIHDPLLLNSYLLKKLKLKKLPKPRSTTKLNTINHPTAKRRYGFNEVRLVLTAYATKEDYQEWLLKLSIEEATFMSWLENARRLRSDARFKTSAGNSKLFKVNDKVSLVPKLDKFDEDKKILTHITEKFRKLYTESKLPRPLLLKFILLTLMNSTHQRNYIMFRDISHLKGYIEVLSELIHKKNIRLTIYNEARATKFEEKELAQVLYIMKSYRPHIKHEGTKQHNNRSTFRVAISIASQTEEERIANNIKKPIEQWTVRTLQIFCHHAYIMMGNIIESNEK
ncbi:tyrosine-type recombinase/integrase [Psychrobacter sanguinis]|uniref:tyrosine-type recombinase/integrase n=1 Tax=Psychrobacter sanguinis TaxID=861445 RepID=UPI00191A9FC7|nr:site-specific integrase [Psychrobacter sanguinis]UEC26098.1 site-specific integrase [Psychrobacter sanguinis]